MVHRKTRWKWHECLEARGDTISNDSECENDDSVKNTHQQSNRKLFPIGTKMNKTSEMNFTKQQEQFKEEAKYGFVLGAKMARMQIEIERQGFEKKRLSLYDIIGIDASTNQPLSSEILEEMNMGQLQVIVNDLYCQIEANNDELINLLIERDSLSMEQDSLLVDIEDLTQRIQERTIDQSKHPTEYIYILKRPKRSIFSNIFRKKLF